MRSFVLLVALHVVGCGTPSTTPVDAGMTLTECQLTALTPEPGTTPQLITGKGTIRCPNFASLSLQVCLDSRAPDAGWAVAKCASNSKSDIKGIDVNASAACDSARDYRVRVNGRWNVTDLTEIESALLLKPSCQ